MTTIELLDLANKYSSLILTFATIIYVGFTVVLARETRKLREVETTPFISLHFEAFYASQELKLIIKNIGKAPAYNITFSLEEKFEKYFKYNFKNKIAYFAPNQQFVVVADYFNKFEESKEPNIPIRLKYFSKDNLLIEDNFVLEWKFLSDTLLGTDNIEGIKKALEDISKDLKEIHKIAKDKNYSVSMKLKILKFEKHDDFVQIVFSNGQVTKADNGSLFALGLNNLGQTYLEAGDLIDYSIRKSFTAEQIFYYINNSLESSKDNK